jgi:alpha,alpha-trehalase
MNLKKKYKSSLNFVLKYWNQLVCFTPKDRQLHLGLPNRYVMPNHEIFSKDQFYWDSYFVILGLTRSDRTALAKGMVDNFLYLWKRFGIIPMRNRYYNLGTSQIPFLTSMIFEVFEQTNNKTWLKKAIKVAEEELKFYWMNPKKTERHLAYKGLSRYCDHYITHLGAEHESGWDMTSRFGDRCLNYVPVDLNACLYKYENDIARAHRLLGNYHKAKLFELHAARRKKQMNALMWNKQRRFYFDYDYVNKKQSGFLSVAGFYALWAQLATRKQAEAIRKHVLHEFEYEGGVSNTQSVKLSKEIKQHDYPNGWPQQQWIVIRGLLNYGFREDAERLGSKWLNLNESIFRKTGKFWEKYDVVSCEVGVHNPERYDPERLWLDQCDFYSPGP